MGGLEPDVATVISRGDTLTLETHTTDIQRAHNIRLAVNDLRAQWGGLKTRMEVRKRMADELWGFEMGEESEGRREKKMVCFEGKKRVEKG